MSRFKIGQKVVCIDDKMTNPHIPKLKKGKIYEITEDCGAQCGYYYYRVDNMKFGKYASIMFAPIEDDGTTRKLAEHFFLEEDCTIAEPEKELA